MEGLGSTFNTDRPPVIPLDPDFALRDNVVSEDRRTGHVSDQISGGPDQTDDQPENRINLALDKLQEAMNLLPEGNQSSLSNAIKKLVEENTSVVSVPDIVESDEEGEVQDSSSKSIVDLWSGMVKLIKEFVPSIPEVNSSPVRRRRTSSWIDREESVDNLPLHPDILAGLDSCMKEVREGNDRGESYLIGKFLRADRPFPRRAWTPPDRPRMFLYSMRIKKSLEELIPGISDTSMAVKDAEWAAMEARLRELLIALSQLKWVFEAQAAFVDSVIPENSPEGIWRIPETINTSMDYILTFMLDNISTQLSNIVLRRRDLILRQATSLRPQVVLELRGQPVLQTELLKVDSEICEKQAAQVERQVMVQSLKASLERGQNKYPFRGSFKGRYRAGKSGSKSGFLSSVTSSSYRGGRGTGSFFRSGAPTSTRGRGSRGRRGRGRGYNPATNTGTSDSSAGQFKKQ